MSELDFKHLYQPPSQGDTMTLLMLHGTGGDEESLLPFAAALRSTAGLLSPRGKVLENGMPRFFRRFEEGVFDLDDMKLQTEDLAKFVIGASEKYGFDSSSVFAVGYSNGANIAASLILRDPGVLAGAVLFRATLPFEPANPPEADGKPILICAGIEDPFAPRDKVERLVEVLQAGGAAVSLNWQAGGHNLASAEIEMAASWLQHF